VMKRPRSEAEGAAPTPNDDDHHLGERPAEGPRRRSPQRSGGGSEAEGATKRRGPRPESRARLATLVFNLFQPGG